MISPILLYGSEVWEPYINYNTIKWEKSDTEKVQTQFIKRLLRLNRSTSNILSRAEVGKFPLQAQILERNIKYLKYVDNKNNDLVKQALRYEQSKSDTRVTIENIIYKNINDINSFISNQIPLYDILSNKLRGILHEIHQAKWVEDLSVSTKADTIKSFKTRVNFEKYLEDVKNRKHRVATTKIRTSDHNFMIEDGRRLRPRIERSQRTYPICPNSVEDECHLLITCPIYKDRDVIFLKTERNIPAFKSMNNKAKFVFLLFQEDTNINKNMAACIHKWFCLGQTITQSITQ